MKRTLLLPLALLMLFPSTSAQMLTYQQWTPDGPNLYYPVMRHDVADGEYFDGFLKWDGSNGKGGIVWDVTKTPEGYKTDPGGRESLGRVDPRIVASGAGHMVNTNTKTDAAASLLWTEEWTSLQPIPRTLFVDANRTIRVDLFRAAVSCVNTQSVYRFDIELYIDGKLAAGWVDGMQAPFRSTTGASVNQDGPLAPDDPLGYCGLYLRMYPEVSVIPQGASMSLRVVQYSEMGTRPMKWGMDGRHQSMIRIPLLGIEDVLFRRPEFVGKDPLGALVDTDSDGAAAPQAAFLGGMGALMLLAGRSRRRGALVAVLMLGGVFAGCLGERNARAADVTADEAVLTGGTATERFVGNVGGVLQEGQGGLVGRVYDDDHVPVTSAFVLLLGTDNSTDLNRYGNFFFRNIEPGTYELVVEAAKFKTFQGRFTIRANELTRADIQLEPHAGVTRDDRRHVHDYWLPDVDKVRLPPVEVRFYNTVLNPTFQSTLERLPGWASTERRSCTNTPFWIGGLVSPHTIAGYNPRACAQTFSFKGTPQGAYIEHPLILPGTQEIQVTVTWPKTADHDVRRVGLGFFHNADNRPVMLVPRESPAVFRIPTTWEMADSGHQQFTTWLPFLYVHSPTHTVQTMGQPFRVETTLHKGVVPLEPGHRDFWGKNSSIVVRDGLKWMPICCGNAAERREWQEAKCTANDETLLYFSYGFSCSFPQSGKLIPPGTQWVEVTLNATARNGLPGESAPTAPHPFRILYRTANDPPGDSPWRVATAAGTAEPCNCRSIATYPVWRLSYAICLNRADSALEADGFYQRQTRWQFRADDGVETPLATTTTWGFDIRVVAHREARSGC